MSTSRTVSILVGLIAGQVSLHASMAGLRMAAPLQTLRAGSAEFTVGPLLSLFSLAPIVLALPAGRLADRRGYHLPVRIAAVLVVLGASCATLSATQRGALQYGLLCVAALLVGAGSNMGLITIQRTAGRTAKDPVALKRVFSWLGLAPSLSNFLGPLIAGVLIDHAGFGTAFAALALLPLLSLASARLVPHEAPGTRGPERKGGAARDLLAAPMMRRLLLVNWFMSSSWDVHGFVVPVLGHERGLSASAIGSVLGAFALAVTSVRLLLPLLAHRLSETQVLSYAMTLAASVFLLYPWASSVWTMGACASLLGLALGASQPMIMTALHRITPPERQGQALALRSIAINLSSAVMPLGFGALGAAFGASGLFWMMGTLVGAGTFAARSLDPSDGASGHGTPVEQTR